MTKPKHNTGLIPCQFCQRCEGDDGVDVVIGGPVLPNSGLIMAVCNSCAAAAVSQVRAVRMQRTARPMKNKEAKRIESFETALQKIATCDDPGGKAIWMRAVAREALKP